MFYFKERKPFTFSIALDEMWENALLALNVSLSNRHSICQAESNKMTLLTVVNTLKFDSAKFHARAIQRLK
jgi:hypothetical protein